MPEEKTIFYNHTNANCGEDEPAGIEILAKAINELRSLQKRDQWLLVDPNGNVYKGGIESILRVIMQENTNEIFPESTESAKFVENISGWVDRNGLFFGNDERSARYSGATHAHFTGCGNAIPKNSYCNYCAEKRDNEQYMNASRQEWDGKTPLYSETRDEWYFDKNDLDSDAYSFADENGYLIDGDFDRGAVYDKMRLYLCKPHKLSHVEQDYWFDDLGEDGELPDAICEALASLNEAIDKANAESPCSWEPSKVVAVIGDDQS